MHPPLYAIMLTVAGCTGRLALRAVPATDALRRPVSLAIHNRDTECKASIRITPNGCVLGEDDVFVTREGGKKLLNFSYGPPDPFWCGEKRRVCGVEFTCICRDVNQK